MSALTEIFVGTVWMVAARWLIRAVGLISTVILARLLVPADFGVVAMAMFVVGLIEVFSETGLVYYLIRHPDPQRSHFDTVWSLRLLVGLGLGLVMVLLAPAGAAFFDQPLVQPTIQALALRPLLAGLENPGIILFRKNMMFNKDFEFLVLNKLVSFVVTVTAAVLLHNHWSLVIGIVAGGVTSTIQSYRMHPYRPRLDLSQTGAVWSYSFWILFQHILVFLNQHIDEVIVGRFKSTSAMGYYTVAADVAASPIQEIGTPLSRVLFSGIARIADQPEQLTRTMGRVLSIMAAITLAVSTGMALVARDFVPVVLGSQWLAAIPLVQILALAAGLQVLAQPVTVVLNSTGRSRQAAVLTLIRLLLLVAAMLVAARWAEIEQIALARAGVSAVTLVIALSIYARLLELRLLSVWANLLRPILASLSMAGAVVLVQALAPELPALRLLLAVAAGAASYLLALLGLWRLAGRPDGFESDVLAALARQLHRLHQRGRPDPTTKPPEPQG